MESAEYSLDELLCQSLLLFRQYRFYDAPECGEKAFRILEEAHVWMGRTQECVDMAKWGCVIECVLIAQACGRWGNFFNQEAYGSAVDLSFLKALHLPQFIIDKMYIHGQYYQPTFLYESLGCVIGFLIIFFIIRKYQQKQGIQFFTYFIWYGVIRFFIEAFRTDSLYVFGLKTAQLVSIVFFIVGLIGFIYCHFKGQDVLEER